MATDFCDFQAAANYAVPLIKAFSSLLVRDAGVVSVPASTWGLPVPPASTGATVLAAGRGLLLHRPLQPAGRLTMEDHVACLSLLHPDDRLAYLSGVGYSDDDVADASEIVERWLDVSRPSLEQTAGKAFAEGKDLGWIMDAWRGTNPYELLGDLVRGSSISDPEPLAYYATCSATEFALSMLMLFQSDSGLEPVLGGTDSQWAEEDERIAWLGLAEEMAQWPE